MNKKKFFLYFLTFLLLLVAALFFLFQNKLFPPKAGELIGQYLATCCGNRVQSLLGGQYHLSGTKKINYSVLENERMENNKNADSIASISESDNPSPENQDTAVDNSENKKEAGTASDSSENDSNLSLKIINRIVSWGYQAAGGRKIDTIIIHSSYNALGGDPYDLDKLLAEYKQYGVAPHYLIDREGKIYKLVEEKNIAYHAGESKVPDGRTNVNNFSIGIEIMNKEDDKFTGGQYGALNDLLRYLSSKYKIKYVLGHNQISSGRKSDPWNFEWDRINE